MIKKITLAKIIEWGTYLLVFLLPWQTRLIYKVGELNGGYWEYGSNSLYLTEIILWVLVVMFLVYLKKNKVYLLRSFVNLLILGLLFWSLFSVIWALDSGLAIYFWSIFVSGFLFYFIVRYGLVDKVKVMISLVAAGAVQGLLAFYQFLLQDTFASKWLGLADHSAKDLGVFVVEYGDMRWLRAYGSLPHPNMLATFLVITLLLALGLSLVATNIRQRLFVGFSWLIMLTGLLFTFSRVAWLALGISLAVFVTALFLGKITSKFTWQLLFFGFVLVAILTVIFWQPVSSRVLSQGRLDGQSYQEHISLTEQSFELIHNHWISGVGIGNYTWGVYQEIDGSLPVWQYQPVHNIYLLVLSEIGIIGALFFFALIVVLLFSRKIGLIGRLCLLTLFFVGFFDHFLWSLYFGVMLWWLVLAISQSHRGINRA